VEKDISTNIKKVFVVFLLCFIVIISYITYFVLYKADQVVKSPYNRRLWAIRNEVLRGTIYDRNMKPLTKSERINEENQRRIYTEGEVFAHALGYVDIKYGLTGLENKYDSELMGIESMNILGLIKNKGKAQEKIGHSVRVTLDTKLQKLGYDLLGSNRGAVVMLDPKNGEVLAMVSKPSFDPNKLDDIMDTIKKDTANHPLINRATAGMYAPGSTFKTVTAVSALENIKDITTRKLEDKGKLVFNQKESLSNFNGEVLGNIDLKSAFYESSNVFFGSLGMELGNDKLKSTAEKFYFNKNIPSEGLTIENSRFPSYKDYQKGNLAQSGIGQAEILATPMQMALVASTIANDGVMMKPILVNAVLDNDGKEVRKISSSKIGTVTTKDNATLMQDFMRAVVTSGTGKAAEVKGIEVAGKTGTADHDDKKDVKEEPHSWFIGFAPYKDPQVAIAVIVEEGGTGGKAAAKLAAQMIKEAVK
jgi:peptidoglycan glycosyltransferase